MDMTLDETLGLKLFDCDHQVIIHSIANLLLCCDKCVYKLVDIICKS